MAVTRVLLSGSLRSGPVDGGSGARCGARCLWSLCALRVLAATAVVTATVVVVVVLATMAPALVMERARASGDVELEKSSAGSSSMPWYHESVADAVVPLAEVMMSTSSMMFSSPTA